MNLETLVFNAEVAKAQRRRGFMFSNNHQNCFAPRLCAFAFSAFNKVMSTEAFHDQ